MARIPYLSRQDVPNPKRHIVDEITLNRGGLAHVFSVLLHSPEAASSVASVGNYLRFEAGLDDQTRELAILAIAQANSCDYEFAHHTLVAKGFGVPEEAITELKSGKIFEGLKHDQKLALRYVKGVQSIDGVGQDLFNKASKVFGSKTLVDLTILVGYYTLLATTIRTFKVELEPTGEL